MARHEHVTIQVGYRATEAVAPRVVAYSPLLKEHIHVQAGEIGAEIEGVLCT